jgi:hypothetical protein
MTKTTTAKSSRARAISADTETVAQILERERDALIHDWPALVEKQEDLIAIPLSFQDRTLHLPQLLTDGLLRGHARGGVPFHHTAQKRHAVGL